MNISSQNVPPSRCIAEAKVQFLLKDGSIGEKVIETINGILDSALELWKVEHGDRNPQRGAGLLGNVPIPFDEAKPWQCVTNESHDATSLLLKLWNAGYKPLKELELSERLFFAALVLREEPSWGDAYSRLRAMLDNDERQFREIDGKIIQALTPAAAFGKPFKDNADRERTPGPIRKAIRRLLEKNPDLKNPEIWELICAKPPRGWYAEEPKYFRDLKPELIGPNPKTDKCGYHNFCNLCGEERKKVKAKIRG
jgi:hypothetical protein